METENQLKLLENTGGSQAVNIRLPGMIGTGAAIRITGQKKLIVIPYGILCL